MAVKIVRQINQIALLGAPTSAAALSPGHEGAPAALRAAGLIERLQTIGYKVADLGDDPPQLYKPDEESPRARNLPGVLAAIEALKPRVEQAVKSGALPLVVSGDRSIALATIAGVRRYFRDVGMIYFERESGLQTPATTPTGRVDGMVVSHLTGRGAAEMVRFWGEPPLVREPALALFGVGHLSPTEEETFRHSPLRSYPAEDVRRMGAAAAAQAALERIHGTSHAFVLHLGVGAIADFQATNDPGTDGLSLEEVRASLEVFAKQPHLAAIEVSAYNPAKDSGGTGAKLIIESAGGCSWEAARSLAGRAAGCRSARSVRSPRRSKPRRKISRRCPRPLREKRGRRNRSKRRRNPPKPRMSRRTMRRKKHLANPANQIPELLQPTNSPCQAE